MYLLDGWGVAEGLTFRHAPLRLLSGTHGELSKMDGHELFFGTGFLALTGHHPLGWQRRLFEKHFALDDIPTALDIPTGLGKTAVIVVWLLALAWQAEKGGPRLPRRLVYVVNRRTVVDQATDIAERLREKLKHAQDDSPAGRIRNVLAGLCINPSNEASPLAISTLRGELADNREWQADPGRPAIIVGTIDMIGSRLLFSGYGVSRRMRPFHAGLLGHDALLIHDEAHLSPPFGTLVSDIARRQREQKAPRPLVVMDLSATQRDRDGARDAFRLTEAEKTEPPVASRIHAFKRLRFVDSQSDDAIAIGKLAECALTYKDQRKRVIVYVRRPSDAKAIADKLTSGVNDERVALLTGTIRGYERDKLTRTPLFDGFHAKPDRTPPEKTEYLVSTSAGEVGADLDADHMVCDLSTLDSMIQRLGRVNRLGAGQADVQVLELSSKQRKKEDEESDLDKRIAATKLALASLPERDGAHDASPEALRALSSNTDGFARESRIPALTDILLDDWSLTRVEELPGRPPPNRWLHGIEAAGPDLYVAWRAEVDHVVRSNAENNGVGKIARSVLKTLYDKHPILARERLRGPLHEVLPELERIAKRTNKASDGALVKAVLIPVRGDPIAGELSTLLQDGARLPNATVVLPPEAGGLERGMLDSKATDPVHDVADEEYLGAAHSDGAGANGRRRMRAVLQLESETGRWSARLLGSADDPALNEQLVHCRSHRQAAETVRRYSKFAQKGLLVLRSEDDEPTKLLQLLAEARSAGIAQDDTAASAKRQLLDEHLSWVAEEAEKIVRNCGLEPTAAKIAEAVVIAARWHDRGKDRPGWQKAIGNPPPQRGNDGQWTPWAKSGQRGFDDSACGRYRHEFGSLREAEEDERIRQHPEHDLILHLIAAHHGWARPHFEPEHWDIADIPEDQNTEIAAETLRRFSRLQRRFGHWGLAWLEALVRSADYGATERLTDQSAQLPTSISALGENT